VHQNEEGAICHIPPGNPANEHSICVGQPAVEPHQSLHGDTIGACAGTTPPPPPDVDAGTGGGGSGSGSGGGGGGGSPDAGILL
jgi:hypothetical protein